MTLEERQALWDEWGRRINAAKKLDRVISSLGYCGWDIRQPHNEQAFDILLTARDVVLEEAKLMIAVSGVKYEDG